MATSNTVELKGGLIVRADVLAWVLDYESRYVAQRVPFDPPNAFKVTDGRIYPSSPRLLTDTDKAFLVANRWHALAILTYEVPDESAPARRSLPASGSAGRTLDTGAGQSRPQGTTGRLELQPASGRSGPLAQLQLPSDVQGG